VEPDPGGGLTTASLAAEDGGRSASKSPGVGRSGGLVQLDDLTEPQPKPAMVTWSAPRILSLPIHLLVTLLTCFVRAAISASRSTLVVLLVLPAAGADFG
jgi:hypothetical protein